MKLTKEESEDFVTYEINREFEKFKLGELSPDICTCLIFVKGLTSNNDMEIRSQILRKQVSKFKIKTV